MNIDDLLASTTVSSNASVNYLNNQAEPKNDSSSSNTVYSWKEDTVSFSAEAIAKASKSDDATAEDGGSFASSQGGAGGAGGASNSTDNQAKIAELQAKMSSVTAKISALSKGDASGSSELAALQAQLGQLTQEISALQSA